MSLEEINIRLALTVHRLRLANLLLEFLRRLPFVTLFFGKTIAMLSDDIKAATASLSEVATDFPPALQNALTSAFAAGEAAGGQNSDPALPGAVADLTAQTATTIAALRSSLSSGGGNTTGGNSTGNSSVGVGDVGSQITE